jgi:hypothetical protein
MADAPAPKPDAEQQPAADLSAANDSPDSSAPSEAVEEVMEEISEEVSEEVAEEVTTAEVIAETVAEATPEEPAAETAATVPSVASTTEVPATLTAPSSEESSEGGEWDLLVQKLKDWIGSGQLQQQWQAARTPITWGAGLIAVLLVLRIYSALLGVLESIPLLPGLLELAGVFAVVRFSLTRLVRSDDRQQVMGSLKQRWSSFRGKR